jgi:hypothetical protein
MRPLFAFIAILVIGGLIAVGAYDAGLNQAVVQTAPATGTAPAVYYGHPYGYGWGFGFFPFGFLFPLLGLFLFFGLLRAIFGGWGGRGYYYGHRGWYGDGQQHDVPSRFDEWHKRAHGDTTVRNDQSAPPRQ